METKKKGIGIVFSDKKAKWVIGAVVGIALLAGLYFFHLPSAKTLILSVLLCVGCGLLIAANRFPLWLKIAGLAGFLTYVPYKTFVRMELPVHESLDAMSKKVFVFSILLILALYVFFFVLTQHIHLALGISQCVLLFVTLLEFYVYAFRGSVVSFSDFTIVGTMFTVWGSYNYTPSAELYYSVLWILFFAILGFKIYFSPKQIKECHPKYPVVFVHVAASVLGLAAVICYVAVLLRTPFLAKQGIDDSLWAYHKINEVNGNLLSPFVEYRSSRIDKPNGFSREYLIGVAQTAAEAYDLEEHSMYDERPNIILIMNEAFSDLSVLGDFETTEEYLPYLNSVKNDETFTEGKLYMSVLGGRTVNSEFEVLTGNSMRFLSDSYLPYSQNVKKPMPSMVSELKALGYQTIAIHPNQPIAYDREGVYNNFGFDEFIHQGRFQEFDLAGENFLSDEKDYAELIYQYEHRNTDAPLFLFNVTIQNHSPCWTPDERTMHFKTINGWESDYSGIYGEEESYLAKIRRSDEAFKNLVEYFSKVDEPTIICMFGDHQPLCTDAFYEELLGGKGLSDEEIMQRKYQVPYVIWSNYGLNLTDKGDFSANYLGAVLLEEAGLPLSDFRKFQLEAMHTYPVISKYRLSNALGEDVSFDASYTDELLDQYKAFEYDKMFAKQYTQEVY